MSQSFRVLCFLTQMRFGHHNSANNIVVSLPINDFSLLISVKFVEVRRKLKILDPFQIIMIIIFIIMRNTYF